MKTRKNLSALMLTLLLLIPAIIFAYDGDIVQVKISTWQTYAQSPQIKQANNFLEYEATHSSTSARSLYAIVYLWIGKDVYQEITYSHMSIGGSSSSKPFKIDPTQGTRAYILELDPYGKRTTGCRGAGTLYD